VNKPFLFIWLSWKVFIVNLKSLDHPKLRSWLFLMWTFSTYNFFSRSQWCLMLNGLWTNPLDVNTMSKLWKKHSSNALLRARLSKFMKVIKLAMVQITRSMEDRLSKFMKVIKLAMVQITRSMEDERTFSTLMFMKIKLRNWPSKSLPFQSSNTCQMTPQFFLLLPKFILCQNWNSHYHTLATTWN
jgi:hypothetical protein